MDGIGSTKSPGTLGITTPGDPLVPPVGQKKPDNTPLPNVGTQGDGSSQPVLDPPKMMSMEDMMLALQALQSKVMDQQAVSSKNDIQANLAKKTNENDERIKQLEESIEKMADAKKSGTFGKVFGWIAAIAAVVLAVAMIATGVGVVAGSLLLASAVIGLGMQIFTEAGGMEWMAKQFGEDAAKTFMYVMMGIQIALALGSLGTGLASSSATLVAKLPILAKTMGGVVQAGTNISTAVTAAKVIAGVVNGLSMVGQGSSTIATGVLNKDAADASANAKEIEAAMLKLQALMEEELKRLKKILDEMQEGASIAMQALSASNETKSTIIQKQGV